MNTTDINNARFHSELSEKNADKIITHIINLMNKDVKNELHDSQFYAIEGNDCDTAKRIKVKQQMVDEVIKSLNRLIIK